MVIKNQKKLTNKVAIITGTGKGIGKAIALLFAQEGAKVVINVFSSTQEGSKTAELINSNGGNALCIKADATKAKEVKMLVRKTIKKFGNINIIVNNSGIGVLNTPDVITKYLKMIGIMYLR